MVVLALIGLMAFKVVNVVPSSIGTAVVAEKDDQILGGKVAVILPADITTDQQRILSLAYAQAKEDGHKSPELVQGILLQESKAGAMSTYKVAGNAGDQYYGVMQVKLCAVYEVLKVWPDLLKKYKFQTRSEDEIKANLILNNPFNIEVASKYLKLLQDRYGYHGLELMNAYNRGPVGVKQVTDDFHYGRGVVSKLAAAKKNRLL